MDYTEYMHRRALIENQLNKATLKANSAKGCVEGPQAAMNDAECKRLRKELNKLINEFMKENV